MEAQSNRRKEVTQHVAHTPHVEIDDDSSLLTDKEALAAWRDLRVHNSQIPDRTKKIVEQVLDEITPELSELVHSEQEEIDHYVVTRQELHGIIARAAIRGAAQVVVDIGVRMEEIQDLEKLIDLPPDSTQNNS